MAKIIPGPFMKFRFKYGSGRSGNGRTAGRTDMDETISICLRRGQMNNPVRFSNVLFFFIIPHLTTH